MHFSNESTFLKDLKALESLLTNILEDTNSLLTDIDTFNKLKPTFSKQIFLQTIKEISNEFLLLKDDFYSWNNEFNSLKYKIISIKDKELIFTVGTRMSLLEHKKKETFYEIKKLNFKISKIKSRNMGKVFYILLFGGLVGIGVFCWVKFSK